MPLQTAFLGIGSDFMALEMQSQVRIRVFFFTEIRASLATFFAMAYIIPVRPTFPPLLSFEAEVSRSIQISSLTPV